MKIRGVCIACCTPAKESYRALTLLGLQSRFGDNRGQITWNLSALSPKRDWSSKGVKTGYIAWHGHITVTIYLVQYIVLILV